LGNVDHTVVTAAVSDAGWDDQDSNEFLVGAVSDALFITAKVVDGLVGESLVEVINEFLFVVLEALDEWLHVFLVLLDDGFEVFLVLVSLVLPCLNILLDLGWVGSLVVEGAAAPGEAVLVEGEGLVHAEVQAVGSTVLVALWVGLVVLPDVHAVLNLRNNVLTEVEDQFAEQVLILLLDFGTIFLKVLFPGVMLEFFPFNDVLNNGFNGGLIDVDVD